MPDEERDNLKTKRCPRCGQIAVCVSLQFVDDPVLARLEGPLGKIAGGLMGKGIGELIRWRCKSCGHEFREAVYIGAKFPYWPFNVD